MDNTLYILSVFQILFFTLIIACSIIYFIPLILIRRFYSPINIFTVNVSITLLFSSIYFIVILVLSVFYPVAYNSVPDLCTFQEFIQTVVLCKVAYALSLVSIHRLCIIIYPQKRLLKTNKWSFICIGFQWIFGIVISLPKFFVSVEECNNDIPLWFNTYTLVIIAVIPMILLGITNTAIFIYAYNSTRRINPVDSAIASRGNIPLTNRDIRILKHMLFIFFVYLAG